MTTPEETPLLDEELVSELAGVPGLLADVLDVFERVGRDSISALNEAYVKGDRPEVRRLAHALKGAAAQVGAARLSALAARVEIAMRTDTDASIEGFEEALRSAIDAIRERAT
ncbi:MAG: Hpt domain-containing protein [Polyangiaceae bacterium]